MPRYTLSDDWQQRLESPQAIVTARDKLALLETLRHRAGATIALGTNRTTLHAIEQDIRAAKPKRAARMPEKAAANETKIQKRATIEHALPLEHPDYHRDQNIRSLRWCVLFRETQQ